MASIITSQQRAEIESMAARYEAAVKAGAKISDERVHTMHRGAKYVLEIAQVESTNTAFHRDTAKQVVEAFASMVAMRSESVADHLDPCQ